MYPKKLILSLLLLLFGIANAYSQLGIRAGVNMANEIRSFSREDIEAGFASENLTAFQIGLVWQIPFNQSGFSTEIGALYTQKGSFFSYTDNGEDFKAFNELNYIEIPLNIRYKLSLGSGFGIYAYVGLYGSYLFEGKTIDEITSEVKYMAYTRDLDKLDYGYSYGVGIELLRKLQLGATWSTGVKTNNIPTVEVVEDSKNKVFSVNLVYLF